MNWKDDQDESKQYEDISDDDYLDDNFSVVDEENIIPDESIEPESKNDESSSQRNVILITIGIAIVSSVFVNFLFRSKNTDIANLEKRIKILEASLDKFESINEKMDRIWEQAKTFEKLEDKIDRTEASLTLRMDHLAMSQDTIQNKMQKIQVIKSPVASRITTPQTQSTPAPRVSTNPPVQRIDADTNGLSAPRYHIVQGGETLYRISLMYNLSIDELIRINQLPEKPVIKVGEKLLVSAPN